VTDKPSTFDDDNEEPMRFETRKWTMDEYLVYMPECDAYRAPETWEEYESLPYWRGRNPCPKDYDRAAADAVHAHYKEWLAELGRDLNEIRAQQAAERAAGRDPRIAVRMDDLLPREASNAPPPRRSQFRRRKSPASRNQRDLFSDLPDDDAAPAQQHGPSSAESSSK
jgi:hypothetical protein